MPGRPASTTTEQPLSFSASTAEQPPPTTGAILARIWPTLAVFLCILVLQLSIAIVSIDLLSSVRAYMTGESLYSKGQKEAQLHLLDYARTFSEESYEKFISALAVPEGDRITREALQMRPPDLDLASRGLAQARNHPEDIPGAIRLFLWFQDTPLMSDAISTWTQGDQLVARTAEMGRNAHERILAGEFNSAEVQSILSETPVLDEQLTALETRFSLQIGAAARRGQRILLAVNVVFAIFLGFAGAAFVLGSTRARAAAEERSLRAERARVETMRHLNETRSAFLSKVSHELRSPLQGIVSTLDVLELRHASASPEDHDLLRRVRRSSLLLNRHLSDLVTLAKGQAGRLTLRPSTFEACALVESVAAAARELADEKGLELRVDCPLAPIFVVADHARIDQVLTNLLLNSIRYTPEGCVRFSLARFDPLVGTLEFMVSDTGPGIDADVLPSLLSPDSSPRRHVRHGEGSGMGLAIVGTLIRLLGGTISVKSTPEHGTEFTLRIPADSVDGEQIPAAESASLPRRSPARA